MLPSLPIASHWHCALLSLDGCVLQLFTIAARKVSTYAPAFGCPLAARNTGKSCLPNQHRRCCCFCQGMLSHCLVGSFRAPFALFTIQTVSNWKRWHTHNQPSRCCWGCRCCCCFQPGKSQRKHQVGHVYCLALAVFAACPSGVPLW